MKVKRPIIWVSGFYGIGILIGCFIELKPEFLFILAITVFVLGIISNLIWREFWVLSLFVIFLFIGLSNTHYRAVPNRELDMFLEEEVILHGQILEKINQTRDKLSFVLEMDGLYHGERFYENGQKIRTTIYVNPESEGYPIVNVGDRIEIKGEIERPRGRRNPEGFDYRAYLARRDIHYTLSIPAKNIISIMPQRLSPPRQWFMVTKSYIAKTFDTYVGGGEANLLKSMIVGERWGLPSELRKEFSDTGIAHILAISGLHVGFLVLLLNYITKKLTLSPKAGFFVQGTALVLYCVLVGAGPSIVRATIMSLIILGGRALGRRSDPLNSLCLAAFIILIRNPLDLLDVGFQLSFGAVLGIVLYNEPFTNVIQNRLGFIPEGIGSSIAIMISAQVGTWPLIAFYFNMFSPISFIANLILIPLAGVIVTLGFLIPLISPIFPAFASIIGWWAKVISGLLIDVNSGLSKLPWATLRVVSPGLLFMVIYYFILLILSYEKPKFIKKPVYLSIVLSSILVINAVAVPLLDRDLKVIFVDVGQGDCIYIKTPDRKHILIDGGGRREGAGDFDVGSEIVLPFLLKNGVRKLDLMAMSHGHDDHFGGLIPVAEEIKIGAFMEYPPREPTERYMVLKETIETKKVLCIDAQGGQSYRVGEDLYMDIIYPVPQMEILDNLYAGNENNLSLVIRVRYGDTSILLTGDIEDGVESYLSKNWKGRVSILKVAHHGSKTSSIEEWLQVIDPDIAVIQSGKNNFGHPDPRVVERLMDRGTRVLGNHSQGAIICTYKKGEWHIKTMVDE